MLRILTLAFLALSLLPHSLSSARAQEEEKPSAGKAALLRMLDNLEELPLTLMFGSWSGLVPEMFTEPGLRTIPLGTVELESGMLVHQAMLSIRREVYPAAEGYTQYGKFLVRDVFQIYFQTGPEVDIPLIGLLGPTIGAKVSVMKEIIGVHYVDDELSAYGSGFWQRYGLPWQLMKMSSLGKALDMPAGSGILSNTYVDTLVRAGLGVGVGMFDLGGLRVDAKRFLMSSKILYRPDSDTVQVIREFEPGGETSVGLPIYFMVFAVNVINAERSRSEYSREVYTFTRLQTNEAEVDGNFQTALKHRVSAREKADLRQAYNLDADIKQSGFAMMKLPFLSIPERKRALEIIDRTQGGEDEAEHFVHAFAVAESKRKTVSSEAKIQESFEEAYLSIVFRHYQSGMKAALLAKRLATLDQMSEGLFACDLSSMDAAENLGPKQVRLQIEVGTEQLRKLHELGPELACAAAGEACTRSFKGLFKDLEKTKSPGQWAYQLVRYIEAHGNDARTIHALVALMGPEELHFKGEIESIETPWIKFRQKLAKKLLLNPVCNGEYERGQDVADEVLGKLQEAALIMMAPVPTVEPRLTRIADRP